MGEHQHRTAEYKPNVSKIRQRLHSWPLTLWGRMEAARAKFKVPVLDREGKQIDTRTPSMDECVEFWMGAFLDMFEQALRQQERKDAMVVTPDELRQAGAKLPPDLLRRM